MTAEFSAISEGLAPGSRGVSALERLFLNDMRSARGLASGLLTAHFRGDRLRFARAPGIALAWALG